MEWESGTSTLSGRLHAVQALARSGEKCRLAVLDQNGSHNLLAWWCWADADCFQVPYQQRLRPRPSANARGSSAWGWGPTRSERCKVCQKISGEQTAHGVRESD
jgi:hypothetical protein